MRRHLAVRAPLIAITGVLLGAALTLGFYWLMNPREASGLRNGGALMALGVSPGPDKEAVFISALEVAEAISLSDYAALSEWVHPTEGCLFTPFSTVDADRNLSFTAADVKSMANDRTEYSWGVDAYTGRPITLTPANYFREYLQKRNYADAPAVGFNTVLYSGNAVENVLEQFPEAWVVDLYFPGTTIEASNAPGNDWCSLKLVLAEWNGQLKLRAVVRSVYTEQ